MKTGNCNKKKKKDDGISHKLRKKSEFREKKSEEKKVRIQRQKKSKQWQKVKIILKNKKLKSPNFDSCCVSSVQSYDCLNSYGALLNTQHTNKKTITFPPRLALGGFPALTTLAGPVDSVETNQRWSTLKPALHTDPLKARCEQQCVH